MRNQLTPEVAASRIVKRYHKLHVPLVELVQLLQDMVPAGMELDENVKVVRENGVVKVSYRARPIRITIVDGGMQFELKLSKSKVQKP